MTKKIIKRRFYGRRKARPLKGAREDAMESIFPHIAIDNAILTRDRTVSPDVLFEKPFKNYAMEIGLGSGEHLSALLPKYPQTGFIGAEPFMNGMACFAKYIAEDNLPMDNIRALMDNAFFILESLQDNSLDKIYLLNPDPWPKTRHHKRRFINQDNLTELARVMKIGAELVMATDVDELAEWMMEHCEAHPAFNWAAGAKDNTQTPPSEWIETRYAFKGRTEGRKQSFLRFVRI